MHVGDGAAQSSAAGRGKIVEGLYETHEDMRTGRAELDEERGLVGLDPGIDDLGTLDGGGLLPAGPGRRVDDDAVLAGRQVLDQQGAVRTRLQGAVAQREHDRVTVNVKTGEIGEDITVGVTIGITGLIIRSTQRIAEGILDHLATGDAVAAGRLLELDVELGPVDVAGITRRVGWSLPEDPARR